MKTIILAIYLLIIFSVTTLNSQSIYFPPLKTDNWENISPESLGWDTSKIEQLYNFLQQNNSKAFILLKDGKIVLEKYFGNFTKDSNWYWASAGKTLTASLVGIAQEEGILSISDKTSKYLGQGWTSLDVSKEDLISIRHQLTMTTGLDDGVDNPYCTDKNCLVYKSDAGDRWSYHNAPYTLLDKVIESASGQNYNSYFTKSIRNKIGMNGIWAKVDFNNVYISTPRSMARYGILMLNRGVWASNRIIPEQYYIDMTNTSQTLNKSYGYLWWLNGKDSYMVPQTQFVFKSMLFEDAPKDVFAAIGKNGQYLNICPSKGLVFVRMGDAPGNALEVPWAYNNDIWKLLLQIINDESAVEIDDLGIKKSIFPNPSTDNIEINLDFINSKFNSLLDGQQVLKIYDLVGECVITESIQLMNSSHKTNIEQLPRGVYFLKIGNYIGKFAKI